VIGNRLAIVIGNNDLRTINPLGYPRTPTGQYLQTRWDRQLITVDLASSWRQTFGKSFTGMSSVRGQMFDSRLYSTDLQGDDFAGRGVPTLISASLRQITDMNQQRVINAGCCAQQMNRLA